MNLPLVVSAGVAAVALANVVLVFGNPVRRKRIIARLWPRALTVPKSLVDDESEGTAGGRNHSRRVLTDFRAVRNWTRAIRTDQEGSLGTQIDDKRIEQWTDIATEVRLRKSLILAAAYDLGQAVNDLSEHSDVTLRVSEIGSDDASQSNQPIAGLPTLDRGNRNVSVTPNTDATEEKAPKPPTIRPSTGGAEPSALDYVRPGALATAVGTVSAGNADESRANHSDAGTIRSSRDDRVVPNVLVMAATDVFAEKAQKTLTDRAWWLIALGSIVGTIAVVSLVWGAYWISSKPVAELFGLEQNRPSESVPPGDRDPDQPKGLVDTQRSNAGNSNPDANRLDFKNYAGYFVALVIIQRVTISGLLLGAVYLLVMVARALLHEAMVLYGRRHSLRFGRLYVYTKLGHVTYGEMEKAFGWSSEHRSAFADIRGEKVSKNLVQVIADVAKEVAKSTAIAVSEVAKTKKG